MTLIFLLATLGCSTNRRRKLMTYLESLENSEKGICAFKCKNIDLKIWPFWHDFQLISVKSNLWWPHRFKWPSLSISTRKMTQKTCVARHVCDIYFLATPCDMTLTLPGMNFVLTQYPSQTFTRFLCGFELFAAHLTGPTAQNAVTVFFFTFDPALTLHVTFILKC